MRVIPDIPVIHLKDDRLGREPMADLIVESINQLASSERHPCTVYGIYGKWGEGKSSLMNFVGEELSVAGEKNKISVIEFNPWLVNNDEALLREFFKTLCSNTNEKIKEFLKKYAAWMIFTSKTVVNALIPGAGVRLANGIKMLKKAVSDAEDTIAELKKKVYRYMFVRYEDYANKKPQDSDILDKTFTYIFANSELNFCLHFLCSANYILRGRKYYGYKVLPILIDRFKAIGFEAQFEYSGYLLLTMLGYWKQADEKGFYEYAEQLFTNSEIPLKSVFDKLIGENEGPNDVADFVKLFRALIPLINECLKKESEEVRNSYSVRSYLSNYRQLESLAL